MPQKNKEKYISLKEAAKISGYSPDYIGYLIRTGKIPGKPVYTNISWQTTAEAISSYKNRKRKKKKKLSFKDKILDFFREKKQKILWELRILKLFAKTFRYVLPIIIILILSFSILVFYIFSVKFQKGFPEAREVIEEEVPEDKGPEQFPTY